MNYSSSDDALRARARHAKPERIKFRRSWLAPVAACMTVAAIAPVTAMASMPGGDGVMQDVNDAPLVATQQDGAGASGTTDGVPVASDANAQVEGTVTPPGEAAGPPDEALVAMDDGGGTASTEYTITYHYTSDSEGNLWRYVAGDEDGSEGTWEKISVDSKSGLGELITGATEEQTQTATAGTENVILLGETFLEKFKLVGLRSVSWVVETASGKVAYNAGTEVDNFNPVEEEDDDEDEDGDENLDGQDVDDADGVDDADVYTSWEYRSDYQVHFLASGASGASSVFEANSLYWANVSNESGAQIGSGEVKLDMTNSDSAQYAAAYKNAVWKTADDLVVYNPDDPQQYYELAQGEDVDEVSLVPYYGIVFEPNGASDTAQSDEFALTSTGQVALDLSKAPSYTRSGFKFVGWSTSKNATASSASTDTLAVAGASADVDDDGNLRVYAVWEEDSSNDDPDNPDKPDTPDNPDKPDTPDNPDKPGPNDPDGPNNPNGGGGNGNGGNGGGASGFDPNDPSTWPSWFDINDPSTWPAGFDPNDPSTWYLLYANGADTVPTTGDPLAPQTVAATSAAALALAIGARRKAQPNPAHGRTR